MKKIFNYVGLVLVVFGSVFSLISGNIITTASKKVNAANSIDITPPRCSVVIHDQVKFGSILYGSVTCYDLNGLGDSTITTSDFNIKGGFFIPKLKVIEVSSPITGNNMTYTWNIKVKGVFLGNASLSLKTGVITDKSGNFNIASVHRNIKVKLK